MISEVLDLNDEFLSCREMNRVKRKAKQVSTRQIYDDAANNASGSTNTDAKSFETNVKRIKLEEVADLAKPMKDIIDEVCGIYELKYIFVLFGKIISIIIIVIVGIRLAV